MFIPIDAKADVQGSKKGKLTPAQHAQLNAWCLASKTGILDCLDKCQATATSYTATNNVATVILKKGYVVICGRLVECEAGTEVKITTPTSGSVSGKIILRYNLASVQEQEFVATTTTASLVQQDLNENPLTGIYEFELYSYTATPTSVTLTRTGEYVPDIGGKLSQFEASLTDEGKPLGGYDTSKGTIEERLTALGFKQATITNWNTTYVSTIEAFTQGKIVAVAIGLSGKVLDNSTSLIGQTTVVAQLSDIDLSAVPSEGLLVGLKKGRNIASGGGYVSYYVNTYTLKPNGNLELAVSSTTNTSLVEKVAGGFYKAITPQKTVTVKF